MKFLNPNYFYFRFYKEHYVPNRIKSLSLKCDDHLVYKKKYLSAQKNNLLYQVNLFPSYMDFEIFDTANYKRKTIADKYIGCAIVLDDFNSITEFMQKHFKSRHRNIINKSIRRLENCFNITHAMYYGRISKNEYSTLMNALKSMTISRFNYINKTNKSLLNWDAILHGCFDKINSKNASLYVIYNNDEPINISLNYHYDNILFGAVGAFDMDYSKFGLGHVQIYNLLDWCFDNNYTVFDLLHGELAYKKMWSNLTYKFENHIFNKRKSPLSSVLSDIISAKINAKVLLKHITTHEMYERALRNIKIKKGFKAQKPVFFNYETTKVEALDGKKMKTMLEIDLSESKYGFLKKPLYDFLFLNEEHLDEVKIMNQENNDGLYYFIGKQRTTKITIT